MQKKKSYKKTKIITNGDLNIPVKMQFYRQKRFIPSHRKSYYLKL